MNESKIPKINLLPYRAGYKKRVAQRLGLFIGLAVVGGASCIAGVHAFYALFTAEQEARNARIEAENEQLNKQIAEISKLRNEIALTVARKNAVENLQANRARAVKLFNYLLTPPPGVMFRAVSAKGGNVNLNGTAPSNATVAVFLKQLESAEIIIDPKLIETRTIQSGGSKIVEFSIVGKFTDLASIAAQKKKK